jgi:uncharacterized protein
MSTGQLPSSKFDPRKFADKGTRLAGSLSLALCERFTQYLVNTQGSLHAELDFALDEEKRRIVKGFADATVNVVCQRCLEPIVIQVHADYALAIVHDDDEALHIPEQCDPFKVENDQEILIADILEDELIVSMPLVSYHDKDKCQGSSHYSTGELVEEKPNPFAVLEKLKPKNK